MVWLAPAKINLFLHIIGRREDGYHELQTVFQLLDYCDELSVAVSADGVIRALHDVPGVVAEEDLTVRAARTLQAASGCRLGATIKLEKRIPMGAGLGGGSSDCATVLLALNDLWALNYSVERLAELGLALGADVPVFVRGKSAWAEGIGEQLTPVGLESRWFLVVSPECGVSTPAVFAHPALTRDTPALKISDWLSTPGLISTQSLMARTRNDCESVVRGEYEAVDEVFRWLEKVGDPRMTGTGSAVFVALEDEFVARDFCRRLPGHMSGFVARGVNESPALSS